ncbi:MAG: hypothetical protein WC796_02890 [Candidatus Pacearchaeota archaeon]|jgi:hypothetical protein
MAKDDIETRLRTLERKASREKTVSAMETGARMAGAAVAGGAFYRYLGDSARGLGEFCGELGDGVRTARALASLGTSTDSTQHYLSLLPGNMAQVYQDSAGSYLDAGRIGLETAQKASESFPGARSEVVQGIRGIKGTIIETTKGLIRGNREEVGKTNTPEYQANYNQLAALRVAGVKKMQSLEVQIDRHCQKLAVNEARVGKVDEEGIRILEGLVGQHNSILSLVKNSESLGVSEVSAGINSSQYQILITSAKTYGLQPVSYTDYGTAALLSGTLLAAYAGNRVGKFVVRAPIAAYRAGTKLVDAGVRTGRFVSRAAEKLRARIISRKT